MPFTLTKNWERPERAVRPKRLEKVCGNMGLKDKFTLVQSIWIPIHSVFITHTLQKLFEDKCRTDTGFSRGGLEHIMWGERSQT